jgi:hypothetical protein
MIKALVLGVHYLGYCLAIASVMPKPVTRSVNARAGICW